MTVALTQPAIDAILSALDPQQRAAAELPDGPSLIIAPAGSGKTTTLVARLGVLLARGVAAEHICAMTFNRDAALELSARIAGRLAPHVPGAGAIEVRTLHGMARQILLDAGRPVRLLPDRLPLLRAARRRALADLRLAADGDDPPPEPPDPAALDTIVSAWKIEGRPPPAEAATAVRAFAALMGIRGVIDFDDLVVGAVEHSRPIRGFAAGGRRASATCASTSSRTSTRRSCAWFASSRPPRTTCPWWAMTTSRSSDHTHTREPGPALS